MFAQERQQAVARRIRAAGRLSVNALADEFDVTTETVRRDLTLLERAGLVRRVHGGAVPTEALGVVEPGLADRAHTRIAEKQRVARLALQHLPPGRATVLLDAGSTLAELAAVLPHDRRLSVVTHAVPVAARLAGLGNIELHLLPGRVRPTTQAAVGPDTVLALQRIRADVAFVGTNGIDAEHGLTTPDAEEATVKRCLVGAARRTIVLADAAKLGGEHSRRFADLDDVDLLLTSADAAPDELGRLRRAGLETQVA